jgi:hypothetical protein
VVVAVLLVVLLVLLTVPLAVPLAVLLPEQYGNALISWKLRSRLLPGNIT